MPAEKKLSVELVQGRGEDDRYLLRTASGRYLKMAPSAFHLLVKRDRGESFEEIAEGMNRRRAGDGDPVQAEDVEKAHRQVISRLRKIEETDSLTRSGFWLRLQLLSEATVNRVAPHLGVLFRPRVAWVCLGLLAVAAVLFPQINVHLGFSNESLILGYLLMLASVLIHEFGHASACAHFGARPRAIGFGIYLIYPVFYSDVSAAWELNRRQRVVIDLGGLFFQGIVGALYVLLYAGTGWDPFLVGTLMIGGSVAFSLNPIFRFDGYWMIADALGIHNLSQQPSRLLGHLWKKIRRQPTKPLPWKPWVTAFLSLYSVLSFAIWGLFIWFVLPFFAERIVTYPEKLTAFLQGLAAGDGGATMDFVVSTYAFLLAVLILGRMAQSWLLRLWGVLKARLASLTGTAPLPGEADSSAVHLTK